MHKDGKIQRIGQDRALVLDVLWCANRVPSFPVERYLELGRVATARMQSSTRVSWTALFCRAYGITAREHPILRQMWIAWPWARLYQSPRCVIAIAVNRQVEGGDWLFFGRVLDPDRRSLGEIQSDLDRFQSDPPSQVFKSQWRGAKLPQPLRRLAWWWRTDVDYRNRARRVGTASISSLAGQGVTNRLHPCMMTSSLSFGPVDMDGRCLVTLQCDHRVIDGVAAGNALNGIGEVLASQVLSELAQLSSSSGSRRAG